MAQPRVQRTCVACSETFSGTPKATRCDTCRAEGKRAQRAPVLLVSDLPQIQCLCPACSQEFEGTKLSVRCRGCIDAGTPVPRVPKPLVECTCVICSADFEGQKLSVRCPECREAGIEVVSKKCCECGVKHYATDGQLICQPCSDTHGISRFEITAETRERLDAEERVRVYHERRAEEIKFLNARSKPPKGYQKALTKMKTTPLYRLWLSICATDGSASSITAREPSVPLADAQRLLSLFVSIRVKGYRSESLVTLCPQSLFDKGKPDALPQVVLEQHPKTPPITNQLQQAILLGLA